MKHAHDRSTGVANGSRRWRRWSGLWRTRAGRPVPGGLRCTGTLRPNKASIFFFLSLLALRGRSKGCRLVSPRAPDCWPPPSRLAWLRFPAACVGGRARQSEVTRCLISQFWSTNRVGDFLLFVSYTFYSFSVIIVGDSRAAGQTELYIYIYIFIIMWFTLMRRLTVFILIGHTCRIIVDWNLANR